MHQETPDTLSFNDWHEQNKYSFPDYLEESFSDNLEYLFFLQNVYRKAVAVLQPALHKLMLDQYPVLATETRPKVLARINEEPLNIAWQFLFKIYEVVQDQNVNLPVRYKYPQFDHWQEFYTAVRKPDTIDPSTRSEYTWLNDSEWIEYCNAENNAFLQYFNWSEQRFTDFQQLLQSVVLQYYLEAQNLGQDEQVLFLVHLTDEYEYFKTECERMELFIDCGFEEDDILLDYQQFDQKYYQLNKEIKDKSSSLRNRRIAGEKI